MRGFTNSSGLVASVLLVSVFACDRAPKNDGELSRPPGLSQTLNQTTAPYIIPNIPPSGGGPLGNSSNFGTIPATLFPSWRDDAKFGHPVGDSQIPVLPEENFGNANDLGLNGLAPEFPIFGVPLPVCGNGRVEPTEQCDDANDDNMDGCNVLCLYPVCGNGLLEEDEECDDNNNEKEDGCTPDCLYEYCGNRIVETGVGEQCDDGNHKKGDGCSPCCLFEVCGNGVIDPNEECDDGNTSNDDGCSDCCKIEEPVQTFLK